MNSDLLATAMTIKRWAYRSHLVPLISCLLLLAACETDSYDKGEGKYSQTQADFAELSVNSEKQGVSFMTDEGTRFTLTTPTTAQWIETADTIYRTIIYYNKVKEGEATAVSMGLLPTLKPVAHWKLKEQWEDPIGLESCWLTRNGKYINLGVLIKSGYVDDKEGLHKVALACDTILTNADQSRTAYYRLLHSQEDAPQYYTNRHYLSILLPEDRPDSVCLSLTTFEGLVQRRMPLTTSHP